MAKVIAVNPGTSLSPHEKFRGVHPTYRQRWIVVVRIGWDYRLPSQVIPCRTLWGAAWKVQRLAKLGLAQQREDRRRGAPVVNFWVDLLDMERHPLRQRST